MAKHKIERRYSEQVEWLFRKQKNANQLAQSGRHTLIMVLDGLKPSFNIGKIIRSAEVFGAQEMHIVGTSLFDPSPAKGAFKRIPCFFYDNFAECKSRLDALGFQLFALCPSHENHLQHTVLPKKAAFVVGHEEFGLSFDYKQFSDIVPLSIQQFGVTESLNVAVCASICMYEYSRQHGMTELDLD